MNHLNTLAATSDNQMIFPIIAAIIGIALVVLIIALIAMRRNRK